MLAQLIHENINPATRTVITLRGGLICIFYPRDKTYTRIVAARRYAEPSDKELAVLRREIIDAIAAQTFVTVGNFERLEAKNDYHAAEIWINFAPMRAAE